MQKKPSKWTKWMILSAGLLVAAGVGIGTTYAFLTGTAATQRVTGLSDLRVGLDGTANNQSTEPMSLTVDQPVSYRVQVQNTGGAPQFVRVMAMADITAELPDLDAPLLLPAAYSGEKAPLKYNGLDTAKWIDGQDGYFYYKAILKPSEKASLMDGFQVVSANLVPDLKDYYDGAQLQMKVRVDAVNIGASKDGEKMNYKDAFFTGATELTTGQKEADALYKTLVKRQD